jgi:hypothetical protein
MPPLVKEPKPEDLYPRAQWDADPKKRAEGMEYLKEPCQDQDTLETIANRISKPWKKVHAADLALLNWGTADWPQVNWYLSTATEGRQWTGDAGITFKWVTGNPASTIWVPKLRPEPHIRFRSPGKNDVGHVSLDSDADAQINTLVIPPVYSIELKLGETDALFNPIGGGPKGGDKGVQQRLQATGYLYSALDHPNLISITNKVWAHYKELHKAPHPHTPLPGAPADPTEPELITRLKKETENNIVSMMYGDFPSRSGQLHVGRLPRPGEFAAIRLPGGYCFNRSSEFRRPDYRHNFDKYGLGEDRHKLEDELLKANELFHAVPLVATVHRVLPDGTTEPAKGVTVYFQLVKPDDFPANEKLKAPPLRDKEMDYSKDWMWTNIDYNRAGFMTSSLDYNTVIRPIARGALGVPPADREAWIDVRVNAATASVTERRKLRFDVDSLVERALQNQAPFEVDNQGPEAFVKKVFEENKPTDPNDPQAGNAPAKFGGKRDISVSGEGDKNNGVFEIKKERDGFHKTHRGDPYINYTPLTPAEAVTPIEETGEDGKTVKVHDHAVKAVTNENGHAGVIFRPSRCGGDRYKIRAYVAPPTLSFDGTDPNGPVDTTGTLVVWRNLRIYRYAQWPRPASANACSDPVKRIFVRAHTFDNALPADLTAFWNNRGYASGIPPVALSDDKNEEAIHNRTDFLNRGNYSQVYRPFNHRFTGLVYEYGRAYCECIIERHAKQPDRDPRPIPQDEFRAAMAAARQACQDSKKVGKAIDWELLMLDDPSPFMFCMTSAMHYNGIISGTNSDPRTGAAYAVGGGAFPVAATDTLVQDDVQPIRSAVGNNGAYALMSHIAGDGILPGLTIVQSCDGATWDHFHPATGANEAAICTSGIAGPDRAMFLHYARRVYLGNFPYSATANAMHEFGHVLQRTHQRQIPGNGDINFHETQSVPGVKPSGTGTCVMSYMGCYGEHCGRCSLALRGWITKSRHTEAGA